MPNINLPVRYINDDILKDNAIRIIKPYYSKIISMINDEFSDYDELKKFSITIFSSLSRNNIVVNEKENRIEIMLYKERNYIPVEYVGDYFRLYRRLISEINTIFKKSDTSIYSMYKEQKSFMKSENKLILCIPFSYMQSIGIHEYTIFESVEFI